MDDFAYLKLTAQLMTEYRIVVRDTFTFDAGSNLDDFYVNGKKFGGPRHFRIDWVETKGFAETKSKSIYDIPGRQSAAYDATTILAPLRFKESGREDPIVHECVHFLQHNTQEEDRRYVRYDGTNYPAYLMQRVELEAHLIQLAYLMRENTEHWNAHSDENLRSSVPEVLNKVRQGEPLGCAIPTLLYCNHKGLL